MAEALNASSNTQRPANFTNALSADFWGRIALNGFRRVASV